MLIGELEGEVSTDRLRFEAYKEIERFDFVTVKNPKEGQEWILAQVDKVTKHPDGKTAGEAAVIGFRENGLLKQPRYVVKPGSMVYRADEDVIAETLGLTTDGLYIGRLDTNPDIRIFVNPEELYKHLAILAKTGAGKSYATGVMIEELLEKNYPVLIIDPHGEYHTLQHENSVSDEEEERYGIAAAGYPMQEYSTNTSVNPEAEKLSFSSRNMGTKEIEQLVPTNLTNAQLEVLYNAQKDLKKREEYELQDVIDACMNQESKAKWNLVNILEVVQDSNMFSPDPTALQDLVQPGNATIINLKGVDPERQEMIVYKLAKELFDKRKIGELDPFFMIIEEAHNFVPERNFGKAVSSDILRTIASEGRKFGLGIGVVSQRPARVDKNILSQCNTQLILRVTNPNDLNAISRSFEGVTSEVKDYITALPPGTGLLLGKEYPVMTDIRTRRSQHGGATKELTVQEQEPQKDVEEPSAGGAESEPSPPSEPEEVGPAAAPEPEPDSAPDPEPVATEQTQTIEGPAAFTATLDRQQVEQNAGPVKVAYYPIWVVSAGQEEVAIDGTDGEIKDLTDVSSGREEVGDGTLIETDIDETEAVRIGKDILSEAPENVEIVYYPYFTAGNRVFDAVKGEEV